MKQVNKCQLFTYKITTIYHLSTNKDEKGMLCRFKGVLLANSIKLCKTCVYIGYQMIYREGKSTMVCRSPEKGSFLKLSWGFEVVHSIEIKISGNSD